MCTWGEGKAALYELASSKLVSADAVKVPVGRVVEYIYLLAHSRRFSLIGIVLLVQAIPSSLACYTGSWPGKSRAWPIKTC